MDVLGVPKGSTPFIVNGCVMAFTFFLVRILVMPLYWYTVFSIYNTPAANQLGSIWFVLIFSCAILDSLNVFWFHKIYAGARKILRSIANDKAKKIDSNSNDIKVGNKMD